MKPTLLCSLGILALALTSGCSVPPAQPTPAKTVQEASPQGLPNMGIELKGQEFTVEVAQTLEEQRKGLQGRTELAKDKGMIFVYQSEQPLKFWMKDTLISLDILFFDSEGRFINGHYQVPPCKSFICPNYGSSQPAQFVVELGAGRGQALKLEPGDALKLKLGTP